jgi:hypothetical protein
MAPVLGIWASSFNSRTFQPTGSYDALATYTVPSGGVSSITFAGLPTGGQYTHLQIRISSKTTNAANEGVFQLTFNGDTNANYSNHNLSGYGTGTEANAWANASYMRAGWTSGNNTASVYGATIIDVLDFASVSKNKTMRSLTGYDNNGNSQILLVSGAWYNSSTAVNQMTFTPLSGSFAQYTNISIYGVK